MTKTSDLMPLAEAERAELMALLPRLTPAQWDAPSLCTRWRVRDVVVHLVSFDELSKAGTVGAFLRGGLRPSRVNQVALDRYDELDIDAVIDLVARNQRPTGLTAAFGGGIAVTDGTIHHQDIRRALAMPRTIPEEPAGPGARLLPDRADHSLQGQPSWSAARGQRPRLGAGTALRSPVPGRRS